MFSVYRLTDLYYNQLKSSPTTRPAAIGPGIFETLCKVSIRFIVNHPFISVNSLRRQHEPRNVIKYRRKLAGIVTKKDISERIAKKKKKRTSRLPGKNVNSKTNAVTIK